MKTDYLSIPSFAERAIRLVYPLKCIACDALLPDTDNLSLCPVCYKTLPRLEQGFNRLSHLPYLNGIFSAFHYENEVDQAIQTMKFKNQPKISDTLSFLLYDEIQKNIIPDFDCVVPVPMHPKKKRQRGYNQSEWIAHRLGSFLNIPVKSLLIKTRYTKPQSSLNREARLKNLEGAIAMQESLSLEGMNILLVDDVLTTGTTLNTCAKVLYEAGASGIFASVIAIAGN